MADFKTLLHASLGMENDTVIIPESEPMSLVFKTIDEHEALEAVNISYSEFTEVGEDIVSLETIKYALESAKDKGGLSYPAAGFAKLGLERILSKYGANADTVGLSLESFKTHPLEATTLSLEGTKSAISILKDVFTGKFKEYHNSLSNFYKGKNRQLENVNKVSTKLLTLANNFDNNKKPNETGFQSTKFFINLNMGGNLVQYKDMMISLNRVADYRKNIDTSAWKFRPVELSDEQVVVDSAIRHALKTIKTVKLDNGYASTLTGKKQELPNKTKGVVLVEDSIGGLPGNKVFFTGVSVDVRPTALATTNNYRSGVVYENTSATDAQLNAKHKVLSIPEIKNLVSLVEKLTSEEIKTSDKREANLSLLKDMENEGKKFVKDVKGGADKHMAANYVKALMTISAKQQKGITELDNYNFSLRKYILEFCKQSLSYYK